MRATAKAFSFFLVGALAFIAVLTPSTVEAQEAELNLDICLALEAAAIVDSEGNINVDVELDAVVDVLLDLDISEPLALTLGASVLLGGCTEFLPEPATGFMTVFVLDADGNIIPDATVNFVDIDEGGAVAPNDGSFTTDAEYVAGTYAFTASAPGYVSVDGSLTIVDDNVSTAVNLPAEAVPASGFMTVFVLDVDGNIIPDATVNFVDIDEGGTVFPNDGSFTTSMEYVAGTYAFTASAPGYVSADGSLTIVDDNVSTTVNLVAEPVPGSGYMTVVVQDADGNIIPGATVNFADIDESGTVYPNDGSFTTSTVYAPGTYAFTASAPGYVSVDGSLTIVDDNVSTTVNLTMSPETEVATVNAAAYACEGLTTPGLLTDIGDDCTPTSTSFDFYLFGDESGLPAYTLPVDGSASIEVQVGTYEVFAADGTLFDLVVPVEGTSFAYGYPAAAPAPEVATVNAAAYACEGLTTPGLLTDIGDDCTPTSTSFDFYLSGDGTDDAAYTLPVDGSASIEVQVGTYEVWAADGTLFNLVVPAEGTSFAYGYPAAAPVETGTVTASVFHCLALETPGMLTDIGDDCIPGPAAFDFYLIGDGTDDSWRLIVGDDGVNSITLAAGEYEVYEVSTDTRLNNVVVTAGENSVFSFGIPRVEAPPTTTGILSVSTYICEDLDEAVVLGEIGDDCVRTSTNLSFYLWGDGTDHNWPLTTSATGPVDHELPIGSYEVIDEPTQWTFSATVVEEGSAIAFGIPASAVAPVDPPVDPPADPADPTDPPVTGLPETGTGTSSNVGALGALVSGALLAAGALGVRIRKS